MQMTNPELRVVAELVLERFKREPSRGLERLLVRLRAIATRRHLDDVSSAIDAGLARAVGPAGGDGATGPDRSECLER